ncbi:hypothetical protein Pelo_12642 [Pelomyxa schiedti]|nr:hypothetical protein Pelo_12642 [Pelomyxa schiedti]
MRARTAESSSPSAQQPVVIMGSPGNENSSPVASTTTSSANRNMGIVAIMQIIHCIQGRQCKPRDSHQNANAALYRPDRDDQRLIVSKAEPSATESLPALVKHTGVTVWLSVDTRDSRESLMIRNVTEGGRSSGPFTVTLLHVEPEVTDLEKMDVVMTIEIPAFRESNRGPVPLMPSYWPRVPMTPSFWPQIYIEPPPYPNPPWQLQSYGDSDSNPMVPLQAPAAYIGTPQSDHKDEKEDLPGTKRSAPALSNEIVEKPAKNPQTESWPLKGGKLSGKINPVASGLATQIDQLQQYSVPKAGDLTVEGLNELDGGCCQTVITNAKRIQTSVSASLNGVEKTVITTCKNPNFCSKSEFKREKKEAKEKATKGQVAPPQTAANTHTTVVPTSGKNTVFPKLRIQNSQEHEQGVCSNQYCQRVTTRLFMKPWQKVRVFFAVKESDGQCAFIAKVEDAWGTTCKLF